MFKKDDYIVCLPKAVELPSGVQSTNPGGHGFLANFIYKLRIVDDYNNYQILWDGNRGGGIYSNNVRYATKEEIEEYNRLGKPYDVTTLNNDMIVGEYYYVWENSFWMIGKIKSLVGDSDNFNQRNTCDYLINSDEDLRTGIWAYKSYSRNYRKATQEEIDWLDACISANKFIPKEEALKKEEKDSYPFKVGDKVFLEKHYKASDENKDYSEKIPLNIELTISDLQFKSNCYGNIEKKWCVYLKEDREYYGHPIEKFKPISELKKDSLDDLLIEAKKRYRIGTKFYTVNRDYPIGDIRRKFEIKGDCFDWWISGYYKKGETIYEKASGGLVYYNGKWAEIVEECKSIEETLPDYILATEDYNGYFKTGIIYKVINKDCSINSVPVETNIEVNDYNSFTKFYVNCAKNNYKPSTKEAYNLQEKSNFIVDKWYKTTDLNRGFLKLSLSKVEEGKFYYSERIWENNKYEKCSSHANWSEANVIEATKDEINNFLPKGHPDRTDNKIIASFRDYKIGDKILILQNGGNNTNHPAHKNNLTGGETVVIQSFEKFQDYIVAICEGDSVLHIEQFPKKFEKVEEWIPQVGDWVVIISTAFSVSLNSIGQVKKIIKFSSTNEHWQITFSDGGTGYGTFSKAINKADNIEKCLRKAEPHEIPKLSFEVEDDKNYLNIRFNPYTELQPTFIVDYEPLLLFKLNKNQDLILIEENNLLDTKVNKVKSVSIALIEPDTRLLF